MGKNTSITLGSYFDPFIQCFLKEGQYKNTAFRKNQRLNNNNLMNMCIFMVGIRELWAS